MPFESAFFGELRDMLEKMASGPRLPKTMFPEWWQPGMTMKDWSGAFQKNVLERKAPPVGSKALAPPKYGAGEGEEENESKQEISKEAYYIPPLWGERIFSRSLNRYQPQQAQEDPASPRKRKGRGGKVVTEPSSADAGLAEKISSVLKAAEDNVQTQNRLIDTARAEGRSPLPMPHGQAKAIFGSQEPPKPRFSRSGDMPEINSQTGQSKTPMPAFVPKAPRRAPKTPPLPRPSQPMAMTAEKISSIVKRAGSTSRWVREFLGHEAPRTLRLAEPGSKFRLGEVWRPNLDAHALTSHSRMTPLEVMEHLSDPLNYLKEPVMTRGMSLARRSPWSIGERIKAGTGSGLSEKISSIVKRALGEAPPPALPTAFEASPQGLPADEAGIFPNAKPSVPKPGAAKTAADVKPRGLDLKTIQGIQEGARGFRQGTQRMLDWVKGLQQGAKSTMGKEGADAPYWSRKRPYILSDSEKRHMGLLPPIGTAVEAGKNIPAKVAPIWREMWHPSPSSRQEFAKGGALDTNPYGMPQDQGVSGAMMPRSSTGLPIRGAKTDSAFGMKDNSYGVSSIGGPPSTARNY